MSREMPPEEPPGGARRDEAMAFIDAYGAFRLLIILLAIWSFIEGFALLTGSLDALTLGGKDRTAERIIGAQMMVMVPVYGLLAWRRQQYRLLIWVPYGAQLAIVLPLSWSVVQGDFSGFLLLVVSIIFFVLLFYFWWQSHPLDFFAGGDEGEEDDVDADEEEDEDIDEEPFEDETPPETDPRGRRYRRKG